MRRAGIVGVIALAVVVALVVLGANGVPATTYRDGDFLQFWIQPWALFEGASPYDPVWWAAVHARVGVRPLFAEAVYPPANAFAFLPLALLPLSYAAALWLVGQVVACGAAAVGLARRIPHRPDRSVFLALLLSLQPFWLLVVGGNVTGVLFAVLAGAYLAALDHRIVRCGALLGLLVVKPHPFLFLALAVLVAADRAQRRALVLGALFTAGPLVAVSLLLRPSWYAEWLPAALGLQTTPGSNATVWTIGRLVGIGMPLLPLIGAAAALAAIGGYAVWARWTRPALPLAIAAALPISLAVAPHGWSYDQLVLLVPLAAIFAALAARSEPDRRRGVVVLTLLAVTIPWALYVLAFRRGGEELSVVTPLLVFAALVYARGAGDATRSARAPILR